MKLTINVGEWDTVYFWNVESLLALHHCKTFLMHKTDLLQILQYNTYIQYGVYATGVSVPIGHGNDCHRTKDQWSNVISVCTESQHIIGDNNDCY